jgi:hypothetical protein
VYHEILLDFVTEPSAGTLMVEHRAEDDLTWRVVDEARALLLVNSSAAVFVGVVAEYRLTLSGVSGGSGMAAVIHNSTQWIGPGLPKGVTEGTRALYSRPMTESQVLQGLQYYVRKAWRGATPLETASAEIGAGATVKMHFLTGDKKVQVTKREFHFLSTELRIDLFANPTGVSGGTAMPIHNYNSDAPVATSVVSATADVTTTDDGVAFGGQEYFFGASAVGHRAADSIPEGFIRALPANGSFIVAITNTSNAAASAQYYLTWTEGEPDIPRRGDGVQ